VDCILEEHTQIELKQRQWTVVSKDVNTVPQTHSFIVVQKMYINGIDVMLSIHYDENQFVLYRDLGHAASGTKRIIQGTFSTLNAAVQQMLQVCDEWDSTWEWTGS
jgi:hypothetical protein